MEGKEWCDFLLTVKENGNAINNLNKNKNRGTDGITGEFKDTLAPIVLNIYKDMESRGCTPRLLNTDHKSLAKALENRLKSVIISIVNWSQACSIPGRDIADTIVSVKKKTIN